MARPLDTPLDIHSYNTKYVQAEAQVRRAQISDRNKELILAYRDTCLLRGVCRRVRLIRVMGALQLVGGILPLRTSPLRR